MPGGEETYRNPPQPAQGWSDDDISRGGRFVYSDSGEGPTRIWESLPQVTSGPPSLVPGQLINGSARETQAALARAEWDDYKARFFPLEENLINRYNNEGLRNQAIGENVSAVNTAFDTDAGVQQRRLSRYGVSLGADQQSALERNNQVSKVAAVSDVKNLTRGAYADIDQQILSGSSASNASALRNGGE